MRRRPVRHFTLLELIVVMGILVLLSAVAIPAYSSLFSGRKTTLAANKLNGAVMEARAYAVSNKVYTALVRKGYTVEKLIQFAEYLKGTTCFDSFLLIEAKTGMVCQLAAWMQRRGKAS